MELEREFQTHIHRQPRTTAHRVSAALQTQKSRSLPSSSSSSDWVKLHNPPAELCQDEALLLCQTANNQWVAWIPDYGKILLTAEEFSVE